MKEVQFKLAPEGKVDSGNCGMSHMWRDTKRNSDPTAAQSLQAITRRAEELNPNADNPIFSRPSLCKSLKKFLKKPSTRPLRNWIWSFSKSFFQSSHNCNLLTSIALAGRAAQTERDYQEALKRADETHAFHEHMVRTVTVFRLAAQS